MFRFFIPIHVSCRSKYIIIMYYKMHMGDEEMSIDRNCIKPLYQQVKEKIIEKIANGIYLPKQKLPTEKELCETFNVSRITIRQALDEAIKEGHIYRYHGRGVFVAEIKDRFEQSLEEIKRFDELLKSKGTFGKTKLLNIKPIWANIQLSTLLEIDVGDPIIQMDYIGYSQNIPVVFYKSLFKESIGNNLKEIALQLSQQECAFSSIDFYHHYSGIRPSKIKQSMEATLANVELAEQLCVHEGHPLMKVTSIFLSDLNEPVEFRTAHYIGEMHIFSITKNITWD
jgi:GntR family transcriptional regulator